MALAALLAGLLLPGSGAFAGGPLVVRDTGAPYVWSTAAPISYRTDNGPLSAIVKEPSAQTRVAAMFSVWQDVSTSSIAYTRGGAINAVGAFTGGDVDTAVEYAAVVDGIDPDSAADDCKDGLGSVQSPIIYDAAGAIFSDLGLDVTRVIGFAAPCAINATQIVSGLAVMNGLFRDGIDTPPTNRELSTALFDAAFIHEFGHFSGLDHSQLNVNCLGFCSPDDLEGLPTMFPFIDVSMGTLSDDDIAWISRLYPQTSGGTTFATTYGTITGTVFFSDGLSHASLVNVIARRVDDAGTPGADESRRNAVSVVSGFKMKLARGNSINDPTGLGTGSILPGDLGLYEIPVPAGNYTIEVESIDSAFTQGSSIGGFVWIQMPGTAPAPTAPIAVGAGAVSPGHDVTLSGTDPRYDQFEGP